MSNKPYASTPFPILNRLLNTVLGSLLSHWLFQGMLYMDRSERVFKLFTTGVLGIIFLWIKPKRQRGWHILPSFILAHTFNLILNGQINAVLKRYSITRSNSTEILNYVDIFRVRVYRESSIEKAMVYGSLSRKVLHDFSDIDIRVVRKAGFKNAIQACLFVARERFRATINGLPLDIYVLDNEKGLRRLRSDEPAIYVKGKEG